MSLDRAFFADGPALTLASQEEVKAIEDRRLAISLSNGAQIPPEQPTQPAPPANPVQFPVVPAIPPPAHRVNRAQSSAQPVFGTPTRMNSGNHMVPPQPAVGTPAPVNPTRESLKDAERHAAQILFQDGAKEDCVVSSDPFSPVNTVKDLCSHTYCKTCATTLFTNAVTDESLFPPRCCRTQIPLPLVQSFLSKDLVSKFTEKLIEREDNNRTYCSNPHCAKYIPPSRIVTNMGTCKACFFYTCTKCKRKAHMGKCPDDDEEVLELAKKEGWQRCYHCRNLVELRTGCNHIICRCGAEFCYLCSQKWHTCSCRLWDEDRLIDHAEQVVNRNRQPEEQVFGQAAVQEMGQEDEILECDEHIHWRRLPGPEYCDECGWHMPHFIYECRDCGVLACRECRHNRL